MPDPDAEAAIETAKRAKRATEAMTPVVIRTNAALREQTLALADAMEQAARELREAADNTGDK